MKPSLPQANFIMESEPLYEWDGHKLYFDGQHYVMDSKEDIDALVEHLREIMHSNPTFTDAYKNAKWLYCDFFLKGIGVDEEG